MLAYIPYMDSIGYDISMISNEPIEHIQVQ